MSLLFARVQREAMAWENQGGERHPVVHHVKNVGFAGHVDFHPDTLDEQQSDGLWGEGDEEGTPHVHDHNKDPWEHYDSDLHEESTPDPTHEEQAHYDEHDEYPESYDERRDQAYEKAFQDRKEREAPVHHDDDLLNFVGHHGNDREFWDQHATHGPVDIKNQPVYATQSHVSQKHLDKYKADPGATTHEPSSSGQYLGDHAPMMVTHQGRLHVTEGHHRVAAALQRGDSHINAYHYNADEHGFPARDDEDDEEDW